MSFGGSPQGGLEMYLDDYRISPLHLAGGGSQWKKRIFVSRCLAMKK